MLSLNINVLAWEKVPVPDYVEKKKKSPWNFYDDFEDGKLRFEYIKNSKSISNSPGRKAYKFKKDPNGNTYLEITVKDEWNKCCLGNFYSERAEIHTSKRNARNKLIWYGFRMRFPKDFVHIDDRVLLSQFMNGFKNMKKSPLFAIRLYRNGEILDLDGDTGGIATKSYNIKEWYKHTIGIKYFKDREDNWKLMSTKNREDDTKYLWKCDVSENNSAEPPEYCNEVTNLTKSFKSTPLGEWTTYKIGIHNSKKEDGFIKVYKDDELIMDYNGITYGKWKGSYKHTVVKLGVYRDTDKYGEGYPPQSVHYDDFIVVSDKKTLDQYLK